MADYGILPTGFSRKPLAVVLTELENNRITAFGPGVIQTPQSPMGQHNGLMANLIGILWEFAEETYQSYDPSQAEDTRLDSLAKIRLLKRSLNEQDDSLRQAITNAGRARIDIQDIIRAISEIDGVTYAQVFVNDSSQIDENGMAPGQVALAVLGGDDGEIATELRTYIVPGVSAYGNTMVDTTIDGYCRSLMLLRPILIPISLNVQVRMRKDQLGCPPPSISALREALALGLSTGERKLLNGDDIDYYRIRSILESQYPNIEVVYANAIRNDDDSGEAPNTAQIAFVEMATVDVDDITIGVTP